MTIGNDKFSIPQLGTGVSQVLPILTICLSAPLGSTIIIEQPELHLHPKMQSKLADFFIAMALSGRQCIIETHSEYLIYALRYRISKSLLRNDESIQKAIKIFFAEKKDGISTFQEIKVNKHGEISAWPEDFFDERQKLEDRMLGAILSEADDEDAQFHC
jgi:predicted ATPase